MIPTFPPRLESEGKLHLFWHGLKKKAVVAPCLQCHLFVPKRALEEATSSFQDSPVLKPLGESNLNYQ